MKALDALLSGPAKADEPDLSAAKDEAEDGTQSKGAVVAKAEKDEVAPAAPDAVQQQDLDWAPKSLRTKLSSLDAESIAALKDATLFKQAHTKLRQQEKPELEKAKAKAALWERLEANPEAAAAAFRVLDGKKEEEPEVEDIDLVLATPVERRAYFARIAREEADKVAEAKLRERVDAPRERVASIKSALESYISDEKADVEAVKAAFVKAVAFAGRTGGQVTAENVVELVSEFYAAPAKAPKANGSAAKVEAEGLGKVASPNGRGSGTVAPPSVPAWKRENRGPEPGVETQELALETLRSLGFETTTQGLDRLLDTLR